MRGLESGRSGSWPAHVLSRGPHLAGSSGLSLTGHLSHCATAPLLGPHRTSFPVTDSRSPVANGMLSPSIACTSAPSCPRCDDALLLGVLKPPAPLHTFLFCWVQRLSAGLGIVCLLSLVWVFFFFPCFFPPKILWSVGVFSQRTSRRNRCVSCPGVFVFPSVLTGSLSGCRRRVPDLPSRGREDVSVLWCPGRPSALLEVLVSSVRPWEFEKFPKEVVGVSGFVLNFSCPKCRPFFPACSRGNPAHSSASRGTGCFCSERLDWPDCCLVLGSFHSALFRILTARGRCGPQPLPWSVSSPSRGWLCSRLRFSGSRLGDAARMPLCV